MRARRTHAVRAKPAGEQERDFMSVDFLAFARSEGRFAPTFAADGAPSQEILTTQADRLANWRTL
jgi:hypothetical protein